MSDLDGLFTEMIETLQAAQAETERGLATVPDNVLPLRPDEARERRILAVRAHRDQARSLYLLMIEHGATPLQVTLAEEMADFFHLALDRLEAERV